MRSSTKSVADVPNGSKFRSPFPPLELSIEDEAQLESVANMFVRNTIVEYQKYQYQDRRKVDHDVWKFHKRKENVRVYMERRESEIAKRQGASFRSIDRGYREHESTTTESSTCPSTSSKTAGFSAGSSSSAPVTPHQLPRYASKVQTPSPRHLEMPVVLAVGTIEGTLEDAMHGAVDPSVDAMRVKSSYVDDDIVGGAVLSTLIAPSQHEPFRSLSIKWIEKAPPLHLHTFLRNRDAVILESTGVTELPNGERVGYVLWHTVHLPQTHALLSATRSNMSVCSLFRQHNATSVDVFVKGYLSPSSGLARTLLIKSTIETVVSVWRYVHCSRMKKLAWALQQQNECLIQQIQDDSCGNRAASASSCSLMRQICVNCKKRAKRHVFRSNAHRATCKLCFQYVCASCKIKKRVSYVATDDRLQQNEITLCVLCTHEAMIETDAVAVVTAEITSTMQHFPAMKPLITVSSLAMSDVSVFDPSASAW